MPKKIIITGFIIGGMDAAAAIINNYFSSGVMPATIFQYIASGLYGVEAFSGGFMMVAVGVLIHFFIAIVATGIFFIIYAKTFLGKSHYLLLGAGYGVLIWLIMNLVVVPLSSTAASTLEVNQIIKGLLIHIFIIGIPMGFFADKYVKRSQPA